MPLGFDVEKVTSLNLALPRKSYPGWTERANKYESVRQAIASAPGVEQVTISSHLAAALCKGIPSKPKSKGRRELTGIQSQVVLTTPEMFATLGIPLVQGRDFTQAEMMRGAHVTLVNQAFVRKYLGNGESYRESCEESDAEIRSTGFRLRRGQ